MGPSEKSFNQVKSILSKLDRSIDELRQKRTHVEPPAPSPTPVPTPSRTQLIPPTPPSRPGPGPGPGRAQPLPARPFTNPPAPRRTP